MDKLYAAQTAQEAYEQRRSSSVPKGKCTPELAKEIEDKQTA
ncbi:hypothetical protein [Paenibacillus sp. GCM10028914]